MRNSLRLTIGTIALLGVAACGQADATPNTDLERDLEQTRVAEFELANQSAKKTDVVSATERIPTGTRAPVSRAPTTRASARPPADVPAPSTQVAEAEVAPDTSLTAPRPRPIPQTQPRNRGPYKTVGEIIKNAPFPINP